MSGWTPTVTARVVERDEHGNPSMFHVEQEAEWDEEQVALLLAARDLAGEIGPHGIPMADATSALADPNDRFHGYHYEPRVRVDHAQRALNLAQKKRAEAYPDEDAGSLLWGLTRVEDTTPTP